MPNPPNQSAYAAVQAAVPQRPLWQTPVHNARHQQRPRPASPAPGPNVTQPIRPQYPLERSHRERSFGELLEKDCSLPRRLALAGDIHLLTRNLKGKERHPEAYTISLSSMQRMVMHNLQAELVEVVGDIHLYGTAEASDMERARELLEHYCKTQDQLVGFPRHQCPHPR